MSEGSPGGSSAGMAIHKSEGLVPINEKGESTIPGLYAAGEVTGGIHGANRLGGNALADVNTFGKIAGKNVATK